MATPATFVPDDGTPKSFVAEAAPEASVEHSIQPQDRRPAFLKPSDTLIQPDVADHHTTVVARALAEAATRPPAPAPAAPSLLETAGQMATTHAIKALGGSTMTELWEMAGHSAKDLIEHVLGEPWEATRANLPQPAKTAEFLYHASKIVPGIADFLFTPAGAATAAIPGARPAVQAAIGAYYGTQMAKGTKESYDRFKANPSAATGGQLAGQVAGTLLPLVHAAGTEYRNQVRKAYIERARTPDSFIEEKPNAEANTESAGGKAPRAETGAAASAQPGNQPPVGAPGSPAVRAALPEVANAPAVNSGNPRAEPVAPPERSGSVRGNEPAVPEGNGQQPVRGLPGPGAGGPAGGEPQPDAGSPRANPGRRVTGSANIPLNEAGREQSRELAGRVAGKFNQVLSSPKDRSLETARMVDAGAQPADWLGPWRLGEHEGKPADAERAAINARVVEKPDEAPGVSAHSGEAGESFNQFRERVLGGAMDQVSQAGMGAGGQGPGARVLNVTHGRNLRLIDAWAKAGMPEDKSIDTAEMTKDGEWSKPGQVFRLTTAGLEAVEKPERPGIYFARHGETEFQGKGPGAGGQGPGEALQLPEVPKPGGPGENPPETQPQTPEGKTWPLTKLPEGGPQSFKEGRYDWIRSLQLQAKAAIRNSLPEELQTTFDKLGTNQFGEPSGVYKGSMLPRNAQQWTRLLNQAKEWADLISRDPNAAWGVRWQKSAEPGTGVQRSVHTTRLEPVKKSFGGAAAWSVGNGTPNEVADAILSAEKFGAGEEGAAIHLIRGRSALEPPDTAESGSVAIPRAKIVARYPTEPTAQQSPAAPSSPAPRTPATPAAYGRDVTVAVPGEDTKYPARYAIRELADVQASHNPFTFERNPEFEDQNDRDYKGNKEISSLVVERSGPKFDPAYVSMESATAENGAPVIDPRGNVLGGNSRAMTLGRVYESNPEGEAAYRAALRERAQSYGVKPEDIDRFQKPVLVRELAKQPENAQDAITDFNKKSAAPLAPEEQAVSDGRRMSAESVQRIAAKIENVGEDSTLAQAIEGANGAEVIDGLVRDKVISPQERDALVDERGLTPLGKDRIAKALVGRLFETPAQFKAAPPALRNNLERVAPHVARLEGRPEWSVTPQIREAVGILQEMREHGGRNVNDLVNQTRMDGEQHTYEPEAVAIARTLGQGPVAAARAFRQFANDEMLSREGAQGAFFEPPTRQEAFEAAFGQPAKGTRGVGSLDLMSGGLKPFYEQDVEPALRGVAVGVVRTADDILKVLAPTLRGGERVEQGKLTLRGRLGELARRSDQARFALRQAEHFFNRQAQADNYEFWDRIEAGKAQANPALDAIAGVLRKLLDGRREDVQALGTGKLRQWYENYMPRAWQDPKSAGQAIREFFAKRPFEGGKSFLKHRTYPTMAEGRAAGLKPVTDNPVTMALFKIQEMDRYIAAHRTLNDWKAQRSAIFVDSREGKDPAGWRPIPDPIGTVYGQSVQQIAEYPNEGTWSGLQAVANALELKQSRGFLKLGQAIGRAHKATGRVETLHGTAEDVLAHEIGHQIDFRAGSGQRFILEYPDKTTVARLKQAYTTLKDKTTTLEQRSAARAELKSLKGAIQQRKEFSKQLRDLADLRLGGERPWYTHSRTEKMAQLAQMWVGAREQFERTAPNVFAEWKRFLDENPKLHALRDIEGNTEATQFAQPYDVGGLVVKGHYAAPEALARLMENHLMPGPYERSALFRGFMALNNHLNLFNLGLSAFHVGKTSFESIVSQGALGVESLLRGHPITAARHFAEAPVAPFTAAMRGDKLLKEWYSPGSQGAEMGELADRATAAGARSRMDSMYRTRIGEQFVHALSQGNLPGAILRAPSAAVESMTRVIMDQVVPRLKFGVFADMSRMHLKQVKYATPLDVSRQMANDWNSVENRLGEVTRDNLFWNRYARDYSMMLMRADQWTMGTIRELGGAVGDLAVQPVRAIQGKSTNLNRIGYLGSLLAFHMLYSGLYQYLHTGKGPDETEDWFFPKNGATDEAGRPQRSSLPSYLADIYNFSRHPLTTAQNKAAPGITLFSELLRNRDFTGTEIRHADDPFAAQARDVATHVVKQAEPFSIRNATRESKIGAAPGTAAEQFVGIRPAPADLDRSAAGRLASQLAQENVPAGGRTKEEAARRDEERVISRLAGAGKPTGAEIGKALRAGTITVAEAKRVIAQAHMDPLMRSVHGLGLEAALKVWKAATPEERRKLRPLLAQKGKSLATKTPAERAVLLPQLVVALRMANN